MGIVYGGRQAMTRWLRKLFRRRPELTERERLAARIMALQIQAVSGQSLRGVAVI